MNEVNSWLQGEFSPADAEYLQHIFNELGSNSIENVSNGISSFVHQRLYKPWAQLQNLISEKTGINPITDTMGILANKVNLTLAIAGAVGIHSVEPEISRQIFTVAELAILSSGLYYVASERPSIPEKLGLEKISLTPEALTDELAFVISQVNELEPIGIPLSEKHQKIQTSIETIFTDYYGYSVERKPLIISPEGSLANFLKHTIAGQFLPFTGETIVLKPETGGIVAHELTHAQGLINESDVQFAAVMALIKSDSADLKIDGYLHWLDMILTAFPRNHWNGVTINQRFETKIELLKILGLKSDLIELFQHNYVPHSHENSNKFIKLCTEIQYHLFKTVKEVFEGNDIRKMYYSNPVGYLHQWRQQNH